MLLAELLHVPGDLSAPEILCVAGEFHGTIWQGQWEVVLEVVHWEVTMVVQPGQALEVMRGTNGLLAGLLHVPGDQSVPGT
jgi:hypothetical protein